MSLNWDATKAPRWDELDPQKQESMIYATMLVDMGEITATNAEEFYKRYVMFSTATGTAGELFLTLEDVQKAVGLSTNVFTTTTAAFRKRLYEILQRYADDVIYRQRRAAA